MIELPPGIRYLLQSAHKLLAPPVLAWAITRVVETHFEVHIATIWTGIVMLLSLPLALTISVMWDELYIRYDAARMGAEMPPRVGDTSIGGYKSLMQAIKSHKEGYPADGFVQVCKKLGTYTFNRRMLFENRVSAL